jgi:hypothetical protein
MLVRGIRLACVSLALVAALPRCLHAAEDKDSRIEFNRDIRPLLADACFHCHGPDQAKRKAKLRLDTEAGAFADRDGERVLVPGDPAKSLLYRRITASNPREHMPPASSGRALSEPQIALIRRWIEQGAPWQNHWAFMPPRRPMLPPVQRREWPRNSIDAFVLARLEREGLAPSSEAERTTLIRRVTLDLTGLPPTPAEVEAFLADRAPNAYEKVVDRLLQSPRYGERMALSWLDAARYADTNGYQTDGERFMWRWRDWVIDAFNHNKPFDQFTVEQLAGDMLPGATLDQIIATGFNRNHRGNAEGGIIPEEYAVEYVVDRVETTATVWLGLTLGCARCHDHKYDPFSHKEFYQLFAYFNNVPERGKAIKFGNSPPVVRSPTPWQQEQLQALDARLTQSERLCQQMQPELESAQAAWEQGRQRPRDEDWSIGRDLLVHYPFDGDASNRAASSRQGTVRGALNFVPGRIGQAGKFDGRQHVDAGDVADFGFYHKFSWSAWIYPTGPEGGIILSRALDSVRAQGYNLRLHGGKLQVNLVKRWLDDAVRVETERSLAPERWHHVTATYDGSRVAGGVHVYVDGRREPLTVNLDDLNQSFQIKQPLRIGADGSAEDRFHGAIDDVRVYNRVLTEEEITILAVPESIGEILALPVERRSAAQAQKLQAFFLEQYGPEPIRAAHERLTQLREQRQRLIETLPTTMVMQESPRPRETFVLVRGVYDKHGERVQPGVPAPLPPLPSGVSNNRLGLARWLVDPSNPLTARVAVNRYWQLLFGTGLVKTAEDFGTQGEWPSHPELLDWLAMAFVANGWDIKALLKQLVTSATYRQSSRVTPALLQRDPDNRLLARGPRLRLPAEMIRDQALAASGLLVERLGGPSVKPYQPAHLWNELGDARYVQDRGASLYRRSLYTFWKRTVAPPELVLFDAMGRETCTVRRSSTNTPLQALTLMNDVTFLEAARVLAERLLTEGGTSPEERLSLAFRLAAARAPSADELRILARGLEQQRERYRRDIDAARKLVSIGEYPRNPRLDVSELAAYTVTASLILNLDEVITRE